MYESHITVRMKRAEFLEICHDLGLKAVVIEDDTGSSAEQQMMTAIFHRCDDPKVALREMQDIAKKFYKVIRRKLEKIASKNDPVPDCEYQEFHSKFYVPDHRLEKFKEMVLSNGGHTATNTMRAGYRFVTTRDYEQHQKLVSELKWNNFEFFGTMREFVIYDDNPMLDDKWVCIACPLKGLKNVEF